MPDAEQHWVAYTDPSGAVWMFLTHYKKAENDDIADTAPAQAYDDMDTFKEYGDSDLGLGTDAAPKGQTVKTSYQRREAAENTRQLPGHLRQRGATPPRGQDLLLQDRVRGPVQVDRRLPGPG